MSQRYVLLPQVSAGGNIIFFRYGETNIVFNKEAKSWLMVKEFIVKLIEPGYQPLEIVATFQPEESRSHVLPVGTNSWLLTDGSNKVLSLKLTHVRIIIQTQH